MDVYAFSPLCCICPYREPQDKSLRCLFFFLCFGSPSQQWGDGLEGSVGWFCSLTGTVEMGAELSSRGAELWFRGVLT